MATATMPSNISITLLSSGGPLSLAKALCIETTNKCYLINTPEATSRVLQSSDIATSKIRHIFITANQWELCGGLIGTCLDISSCGVQTAVTLHGPPVAKDVANMMLVFSDTSTMKIDYNESDKFTDEAFNIQSASVTCSSDNSQSYCYLFNPIPTKPKISISKALELEFPISMFKDGVTVNRIKNGETIEVADGRKFAASQLLLQQSPERDFLVVDCANVASAQLLADSAALRGWAGGDSVGLVLHLSDAAVLRSGEYADVLRLFGESVQHVVMDGKEQIPALIAPHQMQLLLHSLSSETFPLMYGHRFMAETDDPSAPPPASASAPTSSREFLSIGVRPASGFRGCARDKFSAEAFRDKVFEDDGFYISREDFADEMRRHRERVGDARRLGRLPPEAGDGEDARFPVVHFLGTSSSRSTKHRNVSAILLQLGADSNILLDCGEGTLLQLLCFYGPEETQRVLRSLKAICVTHMHLDHQSGILCVLKARRRAFLDRGLQPQPCAFVGPRGFARWAEFFCGAAAMPDTQCAADLRLFFLETLNDMTKPAPPDAEMTNEQQQQQQQQQRQQREREVSEFQKFVTETLQLKQLLAVPVQHSTKVAFGFVLAGSDWKLVYSGDTVPCEELASAGADCDLLIHEATFEAALTRVAAEKRHSTVPQALGVARRMRARWTALTHFSARYAAYVPVADAETETDADADADADIGWGFAYDHMRLRLGAGLAWLPLLRPMYRVLFPKHGLAVQRRSRRAAAAAGSAPKSKRRRQQQQQQQQPGGRGGRQSQAQR